MIFTSTRAALAVATLGLVVGGTGAAVAGNVDHHGGYDHGGAPNDIPNLSLVKNDIKAYYGDTGTAQASQDSRYGRDVAKVESSAGKQLPKLLGRADAKPAILVDVDDTTLSTYNYEATNDFGYNPSINAAYIHNHGMTAVFGMPQLLRSASTKGIEVFYLTGRPSTDGFGSTQRADTVRDLQAAGYPDADEDHLYTRDKRSGHIPDYLTSCDHPDATPATFCTTIQYKSGTRAHIESLGYDILENFGDQYSDLLGGSADATFKLPNPMYYLP